MKSGQAELGFVLKSADASDSMGLGAVIGFVLQLRLRRAGGLLMRVRNWVRFVIAMIWRRDQGVDVSRLSKIGG